MKVVVIGGGAAGFFAAINIKMLTPSIDVTILEAASNPLAKVRISGGGRCNLTNSFAEQMPLVKRYPRGEKVMRSCLKVFSHDNAFDWFEEQGVRLVTQDDNCVFPLSQESGEIIDTFMRLTKELGVELKCRQRVIRVRRRGAGFSIDIDGVDAPIECDVVLATTGGSPKAEGMSLYSELPIRFVDPVPSLFSFNIPNNPITELMGSVIEDAVVWLKGSRMSGAGALLITHWGISGPAVLRLSSYAARRLNECDYKAQILINWVGGRSQDQVLKELLAHISQNSKKMVSSAPPYSLTARTWAHILHRANISDERRYVELGSKGINRIVATLTADEYSIDGRALHKEEFVTCGGVAVGCINPATMESRDCQNLFVAGEMVDVDAITGGYNLQAAWSMGFVAAQNICYLAAAES
ncbi:MAG: aminoacetone oxidase family FAD-binding enzyme [Rikenellaceae bacterium]